MFTCFFDKNRSNEILKWVYNVKKFDKFKGVRNTMFKKIIFFISSIVVVFFIKKCYKYINRSDFLLKVDKKRMEEKGMERKGGKYSAITIAEWFLYYNDKMLETEDADTISNLKLQKLLYYAQGCFLGLKNRPLFNENIVNWTHGPVVEEVYYIYRNNGSNGIEYDGQYDRSIDRETEVILEEVYETFGKYSAWGLRNMTHEEDPWKNTVRNQIIPNSEIMTYFKEHYITD